jgi:cytochrome c peroxidase
MTVLKVELGRSLFYDPRLSANQAQSCGDCHDPALAFTDGKAQAVGSTGAVNRRGSMSLVNSAFFTAYTWADDTVRTLEEQAPRPLLGTEPVEMGMGGVEDAVLDRLWGDETYAALFRAIWGEDAVTVDHVVHGLASFQRTLISGGSAYDRYRYGDGDAMDASQQRGMGLYNSEVLLCYRCHGGYALSESVQHVAPEPDVLVFRNTGLYNVDGEGAYPASDQGLVEVTGDPLDMGRFRAPTLRNVLLTAPYMHDGSIATLDEVLDHYAAGGRTLTGENAGDGSASPNKDPLVGGFELSEGDRADLLAFLGALTDEEFLGREEIGPP